MRNAIAKGETPTWNRKHKELRTQYAIRQTQSYDWVADVMVFADQMAFPCLL
ncbi:hypothetical protein [Nitrospira sp. Nam74]